MDLPTVNLLHSVLCVFQTTIPWTDREEEPAPGDQAGEGRHLVDEVKESQWHWFMTFDLWHSEMLTDWRNQAYSVINATLYYDYV